MLAHTEPRSADQNPRRSALPKLSCTGLPRSASICNPFKINTSESVSKQTSLTTFRINTYAKTRGRVACFSLGPGIRHSTLATGLPPFLFNHLQQSNCVTHLFR